MASKTSKIQWSLTCVAVIVAIMCGTGCGGSGGSEVVAQVGGGAITKAALDRWVSVEKATGGGRSLDEATLRARGIALLISAEWTRGEGRELGVSVSEAEARHELEIFKFDRIQGIGFEPPVHGAELSVLLSDPSVPRAEQVWAMELALLQARIDRARALQAESQVTPTQISAYYEAHLSQFFLPDMRDLYLVEAYKKAAIDQAAREIKSGASFAEVAAHRSIYAVTPHGIRLNFARSDAGLKALGDAIFAAKPGVLMGPRKVIIYYLFKVIRIKPAHEQSIAQVQPSIRATLGRLRAATVLAPTAAERWGARTTCRPGGLAAACRQNVHALVAEASATGSGAHAPH